MAMPPVKNRSQAAYNDLKKTLYLLSSVVTPVVALSRVAEDLVDLIKANSKSFKSVLKLFADSSQSTVFRCSSRKSSTALPEYSRPFIWAAPKMQPSEIDPNISGINHGVQVARQMFEGLTTRNRKNEVVCGAAEGWKVSPDGRVWTFYLRRNATWSDGKPVTADDFIASYRRSLDPKIGKLAKDDLRFIKNAERYYKEKVKDFRDVGVRKIDDYTLQFELEERHPGFLTLVAEPVYSPIPRHIVDKFGRKWIEPENVEVNGPYKLTKWDRRQRLVLKKNSRYWNKDEVQIRKLVILETDDVHQRTRLYFAEQSERPDWTGKELPSSFRDHKDFRSTPSVCTANLILNLDEEPFTDPNIRRALHFAIDRIRIVNHILKSGMQTDKFVPETVLEQAGLNIDMSGVSYDPDRAGRILASAGYPQGIGLSRIEILSSAGASQAVAEFLENNLERDLQIRDKETIKVLNVESKLGTSSIRSGDFKAGMGIFCTGLSGVFDMFEMLQSGNAYNFSHYRSDEYDDAVNRAKAASTEVERRVLMKRALDILQRDLPVIPLYQRSSDYLLRPGIRNFKLLGGYILYAKNITYGPPIADLPESDNESDLRIRDLPAGHFVKY